MNNFWSSILFYIIKNLLLAKAKKQEETLKKIEEEKQINKHKSRNPKI
ncbi:hypothetical protein [Spiroplasma endosymbiont of Amphimallon solstitiale]